MVALLGFESIGDAIAVLPALRGRPALNAVEVMLAGGVEAVAEHLAEPFPLAPVPAARSWWSSRATTRCPSWPRSWRRSICPTPPPWSRTTRARVERLWRWREAHPEAAADPRRGAQGRRHAAARRRWPTSSTRCSPTIDQVAPGALTLVYGHLADGNLHVNIVGPAADDDRPVDAVLELVLRLGGSVSAEHGIGVAKRGWLVRQRGEAAVAAMGAVKAALDPDGVLNPGVLLP